VNKPLVSIVIDNYNYADYLADAVASALSQTYYQCEVIVVDDGSTDHSLAVLKKFGNRIAVIRKQNGGQASAFNDGICAARGEYIAFLDADDRMFPNRISRLVEFYEDKGRSDTTFIRHQLQLIDRNGVPIPNAPPTPPMISELHEPISPVEALRKRLHVPASAMFCSRHALQQIFPIPEHLFRIAADAYLFTLLAINGSVLSLREPLGEYRLHGANHYVGKQRASQLPIEAALYETVRNRCGVEPILRPRLIRGFRSLQISDRRTSPLHLSFKDRLRHLSAYNGSRLIKLAAIIEELTATALSQVYATFRTRRT